ncbi:MAG TPA: DUF349 domain-containing protein [Tenuifilaceae bacterium]|nr:DUF349 domain-containing protein [Tenuifilaceae bacterium]HRX32015.1 DUF349 domain-containing protein [Tenuifilaceae bacterium]
MNTNELNDPKDQNLDQQEGTTNSTQQEKAENVTDAVETSQPLKEEGNIKAETSHSDEEEMDSELQPLEMDEENSTNDSDSEEVNDEENDDEEQEPSEKVDYNALSKKELVEALKNLLNSKPIQKIRLEVETIKGVFYRKHKAWAEKLRKEFLEAGGEIEQFSLPEDNDEVQIKELLKIYRENRSKYNSDLEDQKKKNLEEKLNVIEQIKDLVNRTESVNQTFQEFRELQQRFREIGPVPQASLSDLWENYHHHVQNFYDYVKINRELRDLDLKRNLEEKINLCEKAEELLLEPSIVNAFKKLQKLHEQWREVGPVPRENQNEIWDRFKEVTSKINKKHQEFFEKLRDEQKKNLEAKVALCEKAEELTGLVLKDNKEWNEKSKSIIELQKMWKTIGFATKKENNKIYERFRSACDAFFNKKREFYNESKEEQGNNLQLKTELCIQAEAVMESTDWKKTTEELIQLQKRWKEIGPVPRKHSDEIWKRFRTACDNFFNRKSEHYSQIDGTFEANLKAKEALIVEVEAFELTDDPQADLKQLKEFQRRWAEIGFVPIKVKDEIQKRYKEGINKIFEKLNIDSAKKEILKFKVKLENATSNPRQMGKVRQEREKLFNRLRKLESDIALWENNIGFFAHSKNAESMIHDVERKIEKAKEEIVSLEEKIKLIDHLDK